MNKLFERIISKVGYETPIFTTEIIDLVKDYSLPWVNSKIKELTNSKDLICLSKGCYFCPTNKESVNIDFNLIKTFALRKYIKKGDDVFGVFSGDILFNMFSVKNNTPKTIEVVTNASSLPYKKETINGIDVISRHCRFEINNENEKLYTFLELMSIITEQLYSNNQLLIDEKLKKYLYENNITLNDCVNVLKKFPYRTSDNFFYCKVLKYIKIK